MTSFTQNSLSSSKSNALRCTSKVIADFVEVFSRKCSVTFEMLINVFCEQKRSKKKSQMYQRLLLLLLLLIGGELRQERRLWRLKRDEIANRSDKSTCAKLVGT